MEKYRIRPHPCYFMGFSRCSCKFCVFGNQHQFASAACVSRHGFDKLVAFEKEFGVSLKRDTDLPSLVAKGKPYGAITRQLADLATNFEYDMPVILRKDEAWQIPAGAFSKCGSPQ